MQKLLLVLLVLMVFTTQKGFAQRPAPYAVSSPAVSLTLVCKYKDTKGLPMRNKSVMVTYRDPFGERSVVGTTDNAGQVVVKLPRGVDSYKVSVRGMYVINSPRLNDKVATPVEIWVRSQISPEQLRILKNKLAQSGRTIAYLKGQLANAGLTKQQEKEYNETIIGYRNTVDSLQFKLDDGSVRLEELERDNKTLTILLRTFQENAVFKTIQASELTCQGFVEQQSLSFRFKIRYPDWIPLSIDSIARRKVRLAISVQTVLRNTTQTVVAEDGNSFILKEIDCPTSEYVDVAFFVGKRDKKLFTNNKEYEIKIVQRDDEGELPFNLTFKFTPRDGCFPTPKEPEQVGVIGKAEIGCRDLGVELWDGGFLDGDVVTLINKTTGATIVPALTLRGEKEPAPYRFSLVAGDNQLELIGINPGSEAYEVSARARFYCERDKRSIPFRSVLSTQPLGTTLRLTNRTRIGRGGKIENETRQSVIIRYQP